MIHRYKVYINREIKKDNKNLKFALTYYYSKIDLRLKPEKHFGVFAICLNTSEFRDDFILSLWDW
jgi:hypothetical protein